MTNYTVKIILWKHNPNDLRELPIYFQITVNRKTSYISTGKYVLPKFWDLKSSLVKSSHLDAGKINPVLTHRKSQILQRIVELQVKNQEFTAKQLKEFVTSDKDLANIFTFIDSFCIEVKHKKDDQTIEVYQRHRRKLLEFNQNETLHFEDINQDFLKRYERHLRDTGASNNYVHAIWKTLKTFFNAAKKKQLITVYPFHQYENPIYKDPQKDYLTLNELAKWEKFADEATNNALKQTAVYFLFGCYSGLRISDWKAFDLKSHVVGDSIKLRARKNGEWLSIPFSGPLARNIERMRKLPLQIEEPTLNEKLKIIAKKLEINKKLSSHCGRKTFAVTMCADQGISSETCAELMGITNAVCVANYYVVTDYKIKNEVAKAWSGL